MQKKDPLNDVGYIIVLDRPFGTDINFVEDSSSTASLPVIKDGVTLEITSGNVENKPEFDGKFFVKINKDFNIVNNIFSYSGNVEDLSITHQEPLLYYTDTNVNQFTQPGGNGWNVSGTQIRRSSNSSFTLNGNAIPRAEQSFGDGTSFSTLDSNGPRWFIDKLPYEGLKQGPSQGGSSGTNNGINGYYIDISFSGIPIAPGGDYLTRNDDGWVVGSTANTYTDQEVTMTENLNVGKQFYFADDPDQTLYTIQNVEIIDIYNYIDFVNIYSTVAMNSASNYRKTWRLRLDKQIVNQTFDPTANSINQVSNSNPVSINFVESRVERDGSVRLTKNPAVFETKPKRDEGLEIYHEASESFDISRIGQQELNFYNCYVFGNGVESNRVRDDFNAAKIDNGPKVSAVYEGEYKRERIKNGLIYSGLYNFKSGLNNLNQFIIAEKITKDLNPTYGSIQKLFSRQTDLIAFCEDRVVRILANKDAVFNADGNPNLIATNNVLGQTMPFSGNYGISTDPASFASDNYRAYFSDKQRGAVLRLSMDGLTPISEYGMSDYFRDTLKVSSKTTGSYDKNNKEYNLSILPMDVKDPEVTVSFDEKSKGWVSFKSFIPEVALSSSSVYYSFKNGKLYEHDVETVNRNTFYNAYEDSEVTVLLNEIPSTVKNYKTISYEGTDSAIQQEISTNITTGLPNTGYYNLTTKQGWRVEYISTDQDDGKIKEFIKKEGKWFNYIKGINNII